jgi:calcium/calmodulin-dependent protein kinase I
MGNGPLITLCPTDLYEDGAFDDTYEVDDYNVIGTGKFSTVHLCWRRSSPDTRYAVKLVSTSADDVSTITRVKEEIEIMQYLGNHPGIITLVDVDESLLDTMRIVMELCEGGELYDSIQERRHYNEPDAKATIQNLLEAVAYIHSKGIMHRDLKPENILLSSKEEYTDVKISDFGLARISRDYPRTLPRSRSICGSDFYLAPEVIKQEEYGREIDIWAVGVIAYVLLSGSLPFFHQVLHKLYRQIVERDVSFPEEAWRNVSKGALDFILRLLQVRAADRLTAEQCLGHPWLRGNGGSFSNSFQEIAGLTRSNSNSVLGANPFRDVSGTSGNHDLQKVLSKSTSNAHPLEHAHKVDTPGAPARNIFGSAPALGLGGRPGKPGGMMSRPPANFVPNMPMQSRAAGPIRYR